MTSLPDMSGTVAVSGFDDADYNGGYIFGSWFTTGESRKYKKGAFGRVTPNTTVGKDGWGAWELATRYSYVSLDDGDTIGGEEAGITVGLNWYATKYVRFMTNYVYVDADQISTKTAGADNVEDKPGIYLMLAQIDF
jgi:phosphate-selective porin OprO/OprP